MQSPESTQFYTAPPTLYAQVTTTQSPPERTPTPAAGSVTQDAALLLVPICFVAIWAAVVCVISDSWKLSRKEMNNSKQIAQLPCKKCRFFSNNPYIKCAVNPHVAMTKSALDCTDFQPRERKLPQNNHRK